MEHSQSAMGCLSSRQDSQAEAVVAGLTKLTQQYRGQAEQHAIRINRLMVDLRKAKTKKERAQIAGKIIKLQKAEKNLSRKADSFQDIATKAQSLDDIKIEHSVMRSVAAMMGKAPKLADVEDTVDRYAAGSDSVTDVEDAMKLNSTDTEPTDEEIAELLSSLRDDEEEDLLDRLQRAPVSVNATRSRTFEIEETEQEPSQAEADPRKPLACREEDTAFLL